MRLDILKRGYGPGTKLLFALIRVFSGHPVPDAAKLVFYRPGFYGARAKKFTHEAMPSASNCSAPRVSRPEPSTCSSELPMTPSMLSIRYLPCLVCSQ
jgi:hypothetical protein